MNRNYNSILNKFINIKDLDIIIRHDVDYSIDNLDEILSIEYNNNIISIIYFLPVFDKEIYKNSPYLIEDIIKIYNKYVDKGFKFGIHIDICDHVDNLNDAKKKYIYHLNTFKKFNINIDSCTAHGYDKSLTKLKNFNNWDIENYSDSQLDLPDSFKKKYNSYDNDNRIIDSCGKIQSVINNKILNVTNYSLMLSIYNNNNSIIDKIIGTGVDVNYISTNGLTPLMLAVYNNNSYILDKLISAGADFNYISTNGLTPLMLAVYNNNINIFLRLVGSGANVNYVMPNGLNILGLACQFQYEEIIKLIIINIPIKKNINCIPPIYIAKLKDNKNIIDIIHKFDNYYNDNEYNLFKKKYNDFKININNFEINSIFDLNKKNSLNLFDITKKYIEKNNIKRIWMLFHPCHFMNENNNILFTKKICCYDNSFFEKNIMNINYYELFLKKYKKKVNTEIHAVFSIKDRPIIVYSLNKIYEIIKDNFKHLNVLFDAGGGWGCLGSVFVDCDNIKYICNDLNSDLINLGKKIYNENYDNYLSYIIKNFYELNSDDYINNNHNNIFIHLDYENGSPECGWFKIDYNKIYNFAKKFDYIVISICKQNCKEINLMNPYTIIKEEDFENIFCKTHNIIEKNIQCDNWRIVYTLKKKI
jgi:uncharacterized protein